MFVLDFKHNYIAPYPINIRPYQPQSYQSIMNRSLLGDYLLHRGYWTLTFFPRRSSVDPERAYSHKNQQYNAYHWNQQDSVPFADPAGLIGSCFQLIALKPLLYCRQLAFFSIVTYRNLLFLTIDRNLYIKRHTSRERLLSSSFQS